jgi:hypothetical protein
MLRKALCEGKLLKSLKIGTKFKRTSASTRRKAALAAAAAAAAVGDNQKSIPHLATTATATKPRRRVAVEKTIPTTMNSHNDLMSGYNYNYGYDYYKSYTF